MSGDLRGKAAASSNGKSAALGSLLDKVEQSEFAETTFDYLISNFDETQRLLSREVTSKRIYEHLMATAEDHSVHCSYSYFTNCIRIFRIMIGLHVRGEITESEMRKVKRARVKYRYALERHGALLPSSEPESGKHELRPARQRISDLSRPRLGDVAADNL